MNRLSNDEILMALAITAGGGSTCSRRCVGCVLIDVHSYILSVGRNGTPRGTKHCIDSPCAGAKLPSGTGLMTCEAIHAEQNALLQCKDSQAIYACYCVASPCIMCTRLLMNTSCQRIVFLEEYPHPEARDLWLSVDKVRKSWTQLPENEFLADVKAGVVRARNKDEQSPDACTPRAAAPGKPTAGEPTLTNEGSA